MVNIIVTDTDNESQQIKFYINKDGKIFLQAGILNEEHFNGWCTLDKQDAKAFVKEINKLIKKLP